MLYYGILSLSEEVWALAVTIKTVTPGSPAAKKKIRGGDRLLSINGHAVSDVLDYRFYLSEEKLALEIEKDGKVKKIKIRKSETDDIGLGFETYLMDRQHACKNKCVFCFVDQLPEGLRDSLYFKDDDSRLSFLFGNYITLTNMSEDEIDRIINMHISPVNISVHTMNPELRVEMMKNPNAGTSLRFIKKLADAGITLNTQLVLCPGINDGAELEYSLDELAKLTPSVQSIAAVPVGITCHREGLANLRLFTPEEAGRVIDTIDAFNKNLVEKGGYGIAYAADEFFIQAERPIPGENYYGDYPQLENGVGLWSLFKSEFMQALENAPAGAVSQKRTITWATGAAAYPLVCELAAAAQKKYENLRIDIYKVANKLFGSTVTVAGLLSGKDYFDTLKDVPLGHKVIIPEVSLRKDDNRFLDDMTLSQLQQALGVRVCPVPNDGAVLLSELIEDETRN